MASVQYVHPHIASTITDNSTTYLTADGSSKLFAVFTSEKGIDNQIQTITSVSEYEFFYGEPNIKLYGQVGYNIINWLNAGGIVYCLRVLPEDAGFANAIVNIQTKESTKNVLDANGSVVSIKDVTLRPTITYSSVNNISKSALEINELNRSGSKTIDDYTNNMLFAVVPKGRGKGYNDLGFRMYLTDSYDQTYSFRMYEFEVTKVSESGTVSVIQGPFAVSLDPDAISNSGESLFIVDVIENYCDYFDIIFSEKNYEALGKIINPNVNPAMLDMFNAEDAVNGNDEPITFYCEETDKDENINIYVTKYDVVTNLPTLTKNVVNIDNLVEKSLISSDNSYRSSAYSDATNAVERMKVVYSKVRKATSGTNPLQAYLGNDITELQGMFVASGETKKVPEVNDFDTTFEDLLTAVTNNSGGVEAKVINTNSKYRYAKNKVNVILEKLKYVFDFCRIDSANEALKVECETDFKLVKDYVYALDRQAMKFSDIKAQISSLQEEREEVLLENSDENKTEFVSMFISSVNSMIGVVEAADRDSIELADGYITVAKNKLQIVKDEYAILVDENIIQADFNESMDNAFTAMNDLLVALNMAADLALLEYEKEIIDNAALKLVAGDSRVEDFATIVLAAAGTGAYSTSAALALISNNISEMNNVANNLKQNTFYSVLQDFNDDIPLMYGNDGAIDGLLPNSDEVTRLIVKGYKGTIDNRLTDKNQYQIDMILDANYDLAVKNAIISLTTEIRKDFIAILDTKLQATAASALAYRKSNLTVSNYLISLFTQYLTVTDADYTGYKMQVTPTYFLASKIPANDNNNGIHWNFVGPRRGVISGFESISFLPNPEWKEQLYKAQLNYIERDQISTRFGSNLTSQMSTTALSNINNVRALLRIQREVEDMMKNYQFEYNDGATQSEAQSELTNYLTGWVSNRCCTSISGSVYASEYDKQQKIMRVSIEMVFNSIIERILINLVVNN